MSKVLHISLDHQAVSYGDTDLELRPRYTAFFALMALKFRPGARPSDDLLVDAEEIQKLKKFDFPDKIDSLERAIRRMVEDLEVDFPKLIYSPPTKRTKFWGLNPEGVSEVRFDRNIQDVRAWLGLSGSESYSQSDWDTQAELSTAEALLERGLWAECEKICLDIAKPQARLLLCELYCRKNQLQEAKLLLDKVKSDNEDNWELRPALRLQTARLSWRLGRCAEAYGLAEESLKELGAEAHLFRGQWLLVKGLAERDMGRLENSISSIYEAIRQLTLARWWWGLYAAYGNMASVYLKQNQLNLAERWFHQSVKHCEALKVSLPDAAGLIHLGKVKRQQGDLESAAQYQTRARNLAQSNQWHPEHAESLAELAELGKQPNLLEEALSLNLSHQHRAMLLGRLEELRKP